MHLVFVVIVYIFTITDIIDHLQKICVICVVSQYDHSLDYIWKWGATHVYSIVNGLDTVEDLQSAKCFYLFSFKILAWVTRTSVTISSMCVGTCIYCPCSCFDWKWNDEIERHLKLSRPFQRMQVIMRFTSLKVLYCSLQAIDIWWRWPRGCLSHVPKGLYPVPFCVDNLCMG